MANYKLVIQYMGTGFSGFQIQKGQKRPTVQGELQGVLSRIFGFPVMVKCAGRTDTGVHALQQVVSFNAEREMNPHLLRRGLNGLLKGRGISVSSVELMDERFHARFTAKSRHYAYLVNNSPVPSALWWDRSFWFPRKLNMAPMVEAMALLRGEHDFTRFSKDSSEIEKTVRTLDTAEIYSGEDLRSGGTVPGIIPPLFEPGEDFYVFYFSALSFLHSQVRLMVGNLLEVGIGAMSVDDIAGMLIPGSVTPSCATNPPGGGLYLLRVDY